MSRLFSDVQRAAARDGGAAHPTLRVRDLVATGQVTQHTVSSPVTLPGEISSDSSSSVRRSSTVAAGSSDRHSCTWCIATPVGPLHMSSKDARL